jgi:hypothetical protein
MTVLQGETATPLQRQRTFNQPRQIGVPLVVDEFRTARSSRCSSVRSRKH